MKTHTLEEATLIAHKAELKLLRELVNAILDEDTMELAELVAFQLVTPKLMERAINIANDKTDFEDPYMEVARQNCAGFNFNIND